MCCVCPLLNIFTDTTQSFTKQLLIVKHPIHIINEKENNVPDTLLHKLLKNLTHHHHLKTSKNLFVKSIILNGSLFIILYKQCVITEHSMMAYDWKTTIILFSPYSQSGSFSACIINHHCRL